jgi:hypothetical protein
MKHFWLNKKNCCTCGCANRVWINDNPLCVGKLKDICLNQNVLIEETYI